MKLRTKSVKLYTTSDGRDYEDKNEALAHEAGLNLVRFLSCAVSEADGYVILRAIQADIEGFREVIGPLMRRPRSKYDAQYAEGLERIYEPLEAPAEQQQKKRRGRPPGSKNKAKAVANGGEVQPTT